MSKFTVRRLNDLIVLLVFITGFFSTFWYKQLFRDGAPWAFRLFNLKDWVLDYPFIRYSSTIVQTPAVIFAKLGASPQIVNWLYCLGYFIYPFIALVFLRFYLRKRGKSALILPLYISFFLTIIPTWAFANSISSEAIVIFWFLYAYMIAEEKPKLMVMLLLGTLLLLSYESSAIFYGLACWILWRESKLNFRNFSLFVFLTILQAFNLLFKVMPERGHKFFESSIERSLHSPFWIMIIFLIPACFLLLRKNRKIQGGIILLGTFLSGWTILFLVQKDPGVLWGVSYDNRVWSIPVTFVILWCFYEALRIRKFQAGIQYWLLTLICLLPGLYHEIKLSIDTYKVMGRINKAIDRNHGCVVLSLSEQQELRGNSYLPTWDLPYLSIVLQKDKKITTVMVNDYISDGPKVLCSITSDGRRLEYSDKYTVHGMRLKGNYDFSALFTRK
mgnify:FL=1